MSPGEPRADGTGWRCACGKMMHCQYVVTHECTVWRCANGHRWGQMLDKNITAGESSWQRIGLPRKVSP